MRCHSYFKRLSVELLKSFSTKKNIEKETTAGGLPNENEDPSLDYAISKGTSPEELTKKKRAI